MAEDCWIWSREELASSLATLRTTWKTRWRTPPPKSCIKLQRKWPLHSYCFILQEWIQFCSNVILISKDCFSRDLSNKSNGDLVGYCNCIEVMIKNKKTLSWLKFGWSYVQGCRVVYVQTAIFSLTLTSISNWPEYRQGSSLLMPSSSFQVKSLRFTNLKGAHPVRNKTRSVLHWVRWSMQGSAGTFWWTWGRVSGATSMSHSSEHFLAKLTQTLPNTWITHKSDQLSATLFTSQKWKQVKG